MRIGRDIFLLFFSFFINTAEITVSLDKKRFVLPEKSRSNIIDWKTSFSYQIITLPKELGVKIMAIAFGCNNQKRVNVFHQRTIARVMVKYFYEKKLYESSLQQSKLNKYSYFEWPSFEDMDDNSRDKLSSMLEVVEKDRTSLCCIMNGTLCCFNNGRRSGLIISEKNYDTMQKMADNTDLVFHNEKSFCCYDCCDPANSLCSASLVSGNFLLPQPIAIANILIGLTCWGACYIYSDGFRQLHGFRKKNN